MKQGQVSFGIARAHRLGKCMYRALFGGFVLLCSTQLAADESSVFSVRLKQAPLVATLQQLALTQNINLLIDDELEGNLSLQLDNVDVDRLLRATAKIKGLSFHQENGIYYLGNLSENEK